MPETLEECAELAALGELWYNSPGTGVPADIDAHRRACPICQRNAARLARRPGVVVYIGSSNSGEQEETL